MKLGIPHVWGPVRDPKLRSIKYFWRCRNCGTYRQVRTGAPSCPQLVLPPPLARLTEGRAKA